MDFIKAKKLNDIKPDFGEVVINVANVAYFEDIGNYETKVVFLGGSEVFIKTPTNYLKDYIQINNKIY